ncbi:hypothetical protein ACFVSW_20135 [Neobacillus sp. NPDC058068]|uniref:hypothetical protein n=1 Tax=Neobacillus sp. NPDC058068 TaxID=3346325 RepID=UPI0036DDC734
MAYFNVQFNLVDGSQKFFYQYKAVNYNFVASEIMGDHGWFGTKGDIVNLSNVLSCQIIEVDEEGYEIE